MLQARGMSHCTRPCTKKKKQNPKAPKHWIFQIWRPEISPPAWLSFYSHTKTANLEEKEREGRHQIPESLLLQSQESGSQVWSNPKNEKKGPKVLQIKGRNGNYRLIPSKNSPCTGTEEVLCVYSFHKHNPHTPWHSPSDSHTPPTFSFWFTKHEWESLSSAGEEYGLLCIKQLLNDYKHHIG